MSLFSTIIKARQVPAAARVWLEKELDRKILKSENITIWTTKAVSKQERERRRREWDAQQENRKRRLARIARKMIKAGMSQADADIVRCGGWTD